MRRLFWVLLLAAVLPVGAASIPMGPQPPAAQGWLRGFVRIGSGEWQSLRFPRVRVNSRGVWWNAGEVHQPLVQIELNGLCPIRSRPETLRWWSRAGLRIQRPAESLAASTSDPRVGVRVYEGDLGLEWDWLVEPGADPGRISFDVAGCIPTVEPDGGLRLGTGFVLRRPVAYQLDQAGRRRSVSVDFSRDTEGNWGFRIGEYDRLRRLVIDPVLVYSSFLGGTRAENAATGVSDVTATPSGEAVICGTTTSPDFPATDGSVDTAYSGPDPAERFGDAYVAKFAADGSQLVWATFLGGSAAETARSVRVGTDGSVWVAGETCSTNFPLVSPLQTQFQGGCDAFVSRLSGDGSQLLFSSYFGGEEGDTGTCLALPGDGTVVLAGQTFSYDLPVLNAFQGSYSDRGDAFICRFQPGVGLLYSTYLGGILGADQPTRALPFPDGGVVVVGSTGAEPSNDFPRVNALQRQFGGGFWDMFACRLGPAGEVLFSTYLGGAGVDQALGLARTSAGDLVIAGYSTSTDFPVSEADTTLGFGPDRSAVAWLSEDGTRLRRTLQIGPSVCSALAVGPDDRVYLGGHARRGYPGPDRPPRAYLEVGFLSGVSPTGDVIEFTEYHPVDLHALACDGDGYVYATGGVYRTAFLTCNAVQPLRAGGSCRDHNPENACEDAFLFKLNPVVERKSKLQGPPQSVSFPRTSIGEHSEKSFTLRNPSRAPLTCRIGWLPAPFASPRGEFVLGPRETRTITLEFRPVAAVRSQAVLSITSSDPARPLVRVRLSGSGRLVPPPSVPSGG